MKKLLYRMTNGDIKYRGTTSLNDYKYILQHSTNIQFKGKDVYCNYNGFHCKFIF
jgi:hypothetical protein